MKCLGFIALLAFSSVISGSPATSSKLLLTPGDNSQYKPGDRYVWFPDGHGNPVLADLHEEINSKSLRNVGANNQYILFTRNNRNGFYLQTGNVQLLQNSGFDPYKQTVIVVHGWNNDRNSDINNYVTQAFLQQGDYNVIVVDWSHTSYSNYLVCVQAVPNIGQHIGNFLIFLFANGLRPYQGHIVGYSLGAHIAGNAGRSIAGSIGRITGLDPAGPMFSGNANAIAPSDAQYVEIIHTDTAVLGLADVCGDADFYPNGGRSQPGCLLSPCSHSRAYEFFSSSVKYNHMFALQCTGVAQATSQSCSGPSGLHMGNHHIVKHGSGVFRINTASTYPY